ncbi:MAG: DNA gyrase subunit A, partial [Oscillospiraceae bacterium]|nr:DNA gyrase subunit A [Oscillospiraceae bacterium]
ENDELCGVRLTTGQNELIVATRNGMAIRFKETDARELGRTARGVKAITLANEDFVVGFARVREGANLLTVSERGRGRRTELSQYRLQSRGGKGVLNYRTKDHGPVAGIKVVDEDDDVILISDNGVIIRMPVEQITTQSRYGGGVRVMRLEEDHRVVTLARSQKEEEDGIDEDAAPDVTDTAQVDDAAPESEE